MQLLWKCPFTDDDYVTHRAWEGAVLDHCPFHPEGGCGVERLGTYPRVEPAGAQIPRWWCSKAQRSISLLPSFLAARLRGTLVEVEAVVDAVERAGGIAAGVDAARPPDEEDAIGLAGALRWVGRRVRAVRAALVAAATLRPDRFAGTRPTLAAFRQVLGPGNVLSVLRDLVERHLAMLPAPFGFRARVAQ